MSGFLDGKPMYAVDADDELLNELWGVPVMSSCPVESQDVVDADDKLPGELWGVSSSP